MFLILYAAVLFFLPLKIQTIESYAYAMTAEGYFDISKGFAAAQPGVKIPDFSRFHPNHPMLHMVIAFLYDNLKVSALNTFRMINAASSLVALAFLYFASYLLWKRIAVSIVIIAMLAFSHTFWNSALSGEVHLPAVAFLAAATYYLLRYLVGEPKQENRHLLVAAGFFSLAIIFHLLAFFTIMPVVLAVLSHSVKKEKWKLYFQALGLVLLGFGVFYVGLLVYKLNIESVSQYFSVMTVYAHIVHVRYYGFDWFVVFLKTLLHAIAGGFTPLTIAIKSFFGLFFFWGYIQFARSAVTVPVKVLLIGWPVVYILFNVIIAGRADGLNGWLFSAPVVCLASGYFWVKLSYRQETRIYVFLVPLLLISANFTVAIFPNVGRAEKEYMFLDDPGVMFKRAGIEVDSRGIKIGALTKHPVETFPDLWRLGSVYGRRDVKLFVYCCGDKGYEMPLREWISSKVPFLLIVDETTEEIGKMLIAQKRKFRIIHEATGELKREWLPSSVYLILPSGFRIEKKIRVFFVEAAS